MTVLRPNTRKVREKKNVLGADALTKEQGNPDTHSKASEPRDASAPLPKVGEDFLRELQKECLEILKDDEIMPHWSRYCYALLARMGLTEHPVQTGLKQALAALPILQRTLLVLPTPEDEPDLLQTLADHVRERSPRLAQVFEDALPNVLRMFACSSLSKIATDEHSRTVLSQAALSEPLDIERPWDNPNRLVTDAATGARTLGDVSAKTAMRFIMKAQTFLRAVEQSPRRPGRSKGQQKPAQSGKPPLSDDDAFAVAKAFHEGNDWQTIARKVLHKQIPVDFNPRECLRKRVDRLRFKGKGTPRFKKYLNDRNPR